LKDDNAMRHDSLASLDAEGAAGTKVSGQKKQKQGMGNEARRALVQVTHSSNAEHSGGPVTHEKLDKNTHSAQEKRRKRGGKVMENENAP
jgi:hypothetical protein